MATLQGQLAAAENSVAILSAVGLRICLPRPAGAGCELLLARLTMQHRTREHDASAREAQHAQAVQALRSLLATRDRDMVELRATATAATEQHASTSTKLRHAEDALRVLGKERVRVIMLQDPTTAVPLLTV